LTRLEAEWIERDGRELHRLDSVDSVRSFAEMQGQPELQATCAVLAEIARTFAHEEQAEPAAFRLLGAVLEALEQGGDPSALLRYYEFWTLRLHGLLPEVDSCALCGEAFSEADTIRVLAGRGLRCGRCRPQPGSRESSWSAADREALGWLARRAPDQLPHLARAGRGGALELLLRGALEAFAERTFRAYRHLDLPRMSEGGKP
jgi:recombinational DNA repair protein (RecF pathway)